MGVVGTTIYGFYGLVGSSGLVGTVTSGFVGTVIYGLTISCLISIASIILIVVCIASYINVTFTLPLSTFWYVIM